MRNAFFCAIFFLGCAAPVPPAAPQQQQQQQVDTKPADIRGTITRVAENEIRVEADPKEFRGAKAVVRITSTTEIISDASGNAVAASALREGQIVRVWYGGEVAQSYPLQTEAVKIVIE